MLIDIKCPIAGTSLEVRSEQLIIRISAKLCLLCVVTEILLALILRHVHRDGVLHDVDHLGVGHLTVNLHHGDSLTLILGAGVGADHSRQQQRHQRSVSLEET